jgi:hypothetical protein
MALRQDDGGVVWRSGDFIIAPTSPILITVEGQDQIVVFGGDRIVGLDAGTGTLLWSHPHPRENHANASTPVWSQSDGLLFVSSAKDGGSRALKVTKADAKELWHTTRFRVYFGNVIRIGEYYYGSSGDSICSFVTAANVCTGEVAWQDRIFLRCSFLYADGKFIILDEDGTLGLAVASLKGFKVLAKASVFTSTSWTVPTLMGTQLYLRDRLRIMALELGRS